MSSSEIDSKRPSLLRLLAVLTLALLASWAARETLHHRVATPEIGTWTTEDPDGMYHARRVDRALAEGLPPAEQDPFMSYPDGAMIPWPPYYSTFLTLIARATVTETAEAERRIAIEHLVATIPQVLGILTTLVVALCGFLLAGNSGALIAGTYHAFCNASIAYSTAGSADHHSWVAFLLALTLAGLTAALKRGVTARPIASALWGGALGLVAGLLLGSWVASLVYILLTQLVLAWTLFEHARAPKAGTAAFGASFHAVAFVVLLPAILSSPWKEEFPWMVVNLSWFHAAHLLLGGLVFVPLLFLSSESVVRRRYPFIVGAALLALFAVLAVTNSAPWRGVMEGFAWAARSDQFMSYIVESRPLLGADRDDFAHAFETLGYGLLLLIPAWLMALRCARGDARARLRPLVVFTPVLVIQAVSQTRFGDALSIPMAVAVGWLIDHLSRSARLAHLRERPVFVWLIPLFAFPLLCNLDTTMTWFKQVKSHGITPPPRRLPRSRAARAILEWVRTNTPEDGDYSVLARWSRGHPIEWAANRPSVATNFGIYVGEESFRAPGRFFMSEDPEVAGKVLAETRARYILTTTRFPEGLPMYFDQLPAQERERYLLSGRDTGTLNVTEAWLSTMGARLMFDGAVLGAPEGTYPPLDFLRLVHVSPLIDRNPKLKRFVETSAMGWIWETVPGAVVEANTKPGAQLAIEIELVWPGTRTRITYADHTLAGEDGVARLRVPYATDDSNGDARVEGEPRWILEGEVGVLTIPGEAVEAGAIVRVK